MSRSGRSKKRQPNWYDLNKLPLYFELSREQLTAATEQYQNLQACKHKPYILDDYTIKRIIKLCEEQNETAWVCLEQCRKWRQQHPSENQLTDIEKTESNTKSLEETNIKILALVNRYFKGKSIQDILAKDDISLALDFLSGNMDFGTDETETPRTKELLSSKYEFPYKLFKNPHEKAIKAFYKVKPQSTLNSAKNAEKRYQDYVQQRTALNDYHAKCENKVILSQDLAGAAELGNIDPITKKIVIQSEAEMNLFYDYLALYRWKNGKRYACEWLVQNPKVLNVQNKKVVNAYVQARFAVLRLDKNLPHGAIETVDVLSQKPHLLMDKALNGSSKKAGSFFICSLLELEDYSMTSGGGVPIDGQSSGDKAILTLVAKHAEAFKNQEVALTQEIAEGVREIYGFCLRHGVLVNHTTNQVY